ncbi:MAG: hypothetical protein WCD76_13370 [Pyrinomonadaceae bacterium]
MKLKAKLQLQSPLLTQPGSLHASLAKVVHETAFDIERDIKEQMREPKSGRTYSRAAITRRASKVTRGLGLREYTTAKGFQRAVVGYKFHRASAAGEAPAVDHGAAIGSLQTVPDGLRATITGSQILEWLDTGTPRIAPRPFVRPALERARAPFERRVEDAIEELL